MDGLSQPERSPRRVRHELRFRLLEVTRVQRLTPHMIRVTLGGDDLDGFYSPGFDDHVKIFLPAPGHDRPPRPVVGAGGIEFPADAPRPTMRDYTPRRFDPVALTLEIDFAIHEAGPASDWARQAKPGQVLGVGGPRGSFLLPTAFDWHLLIGDDTALPAIARRLAELPAGARALVLAEVDGPADQLSFDSPAQVAVTWVHRNGGEAGLPGPLTGALAAAAFPVGDYHAWVACESTVAKALRGQLIADRGANPKWLKAAGYWRRGAAGVHETHGE